MKVFIKVLKQDVLDGKISDKLGLFANIENLDLNENDYFTDKAIVYDVGDYFYILSSFRDKENKCRYSRQSDEEIQMIQDFIIANSLETISISEMNELLSEEIISAENNADEWSDF